MANLVKTKRSIFLGSTTIVVILWMAELSWFKTEVIKKWEADKPLVWSDFDGDVPWGTAFDAGISSKVYAIPDATGAYDIYAGQNNLKSWTKHKRGMKDLLRHEQYHFHISELHARMLEQRWENNSIKQGIEKLKSEVNTSLVNMQNLYDEESDHGLITSMQHLWEYRVDSMLSAYETHQGFYNDYFGGTKVWFPSMPEHEVERDNGSLSDCYTSSDYWADLSYCVYHDMTFHASSFSESWKSFLTEESIKIQQFNHEEGSNYEKLEMIYEDTVHLWRYEHLVYYKPPYEYRIRAATPMTKDSLVYRRMSKAFMNNFNFEAQEFYWLDLSREKYPAVSELNLRKTEEADSLKHHYLSSLPYSDYSVAYHLPIEDGAHLIIPFKIVRHPIADVAEILYKINENRYFSQTPDSPYQVIKIDMDLLQTGRNKIQFGYVTLSDSTKTGFHFYSAITEFEK